MAYWIGNKIIYSSYVHFEVVSLEQKSQQIHEFFVYIRKSLKLTFLTSWFGKIILHFFEYIYMDPNVLKAFKQHNNHNVYHQNMMPYGFSNLWQKKGKKMLFFDKKFMFIKG